jgi:YD repeat-containing protein
LASVIYPDATPGTLTDNPRKQFSYWENSKFPFALTGIIDERGVQDLTVTYAADGRVLTSELQGGAEKITMSYDDANQKVTVTNALGRSTVYGKSVTYGNVLRMTSVDGIATTNCAASNSTYAYNSNGFMSQMVDAEGRVTNYTKDARGLPTSIVRGAGTPQAVTTSMTWRTTRQQPLTVSAAAKMAIVVYEPIEGSVPEISLVACCYSQAITLFRPVRWFIQPGKRHESRTRFLLLLAWIKAAAAISKEAKATVAKPISKP